MAKGAKLAWKVGTGGAYQAANKMKVGPKGRSGAQVFLTDDRLLPSR